VRSEKAGARSENSVREEPSETNDPFNARKVFYWSSLLAPRTPLSKCQPRLNHPALWCRTREPGEATCNS
jgi:hypothetical protein